MKILDRITFVLLLIVTLSTLTFMIYEHSYDDMVKFLGWLNASMWCFLAISRGD